jgi:hypothetical protein
VRVLTMAIDSGHIPGGCFQLHFMEPACNMNMEGKGGLWLLVMALIWMMLAMSWEGELSRYSTMRSILEHGGIIHNMRRSICLISSTM